MRIFFTGATGVLGISTLPRLLSEGHSVTAVARSREDREALGALGANPVAVDLFDSTAILDALKDIDTVVHFATSIPPPDRMAQRSAWAMNDRLRSEATGILVDAAVARRVRRFIQESVTFLYADGGDRWLDETTAISRSWDVLESALDAEHHVARFSESGGNGIVLRLARLYGPGRASQAYIAGLAAGSIPIVGSGDNFVSSIHSDDVASAVVAALAAPGGVYNVADDQPIRSAELTDAIARILGAPAPRRVTATDADGPLTTSHRISNRKLREATGWAPEYESAIEGWRRLIGSMTSNGGGSWPSG